MSLYNNHPTFSYISATGISVVYNDTMYTVSDFSTEKKFIYWNEETPSVFRSSNTRPDTFIGQYIVLINENGTAVEVPNSDISVYFDGNSVQSIMDRIYGIYDVNEGYGNRFVAVETNIDGIKAVIGSEENPEEGTILNRITKAEINIDGVSTEVKKQTQIYNQDKEESQLRDDLNGTIIELNSYLGIFKGEINDYYRDNKISDDEYTSIKIQLEEINSCKKTLDSLVDKVIEIGNKNGLGTKVTNVESAKKGIDNANTYLSNTITNACIDRIITESELAVIIDAFGKYTLRISELKSACDDVIFLGIGGVLIEEFSKIDQRADSISLEVSKVETDVNNKIDENYDEVNQIIKENYAAIKMTTDSITSKVESNTQNISNNANNITAVKSEIKQTADSISLEVSKKVNANEIISYINASPETITISSSRINISGFVTFSNLMDGSTVISGNNILTGTINADRLKNIGSIQFTEGATITGTPSGHGGAPLLKIDAYGFAARDIYPVTNNDWSLGTSVWHYKKLWTYNVSSNGSLSLSGSPIYITSHVYASGQTGSNRKLGASNGSGSGTWSNAFSQVAAITGLFQAGKANDWIYWSDKSVKENIRKVQGNISTYSNNDLDIIQINNNTIDTSNDVSLMDMFDFVKNDLDLYFYNYKSETLEEIENVLYESRLAEKGELDDEDTEEIKEGALEYFEIQSERCRNKIGIIAQYIEDNKVGKNIISKDRENGLLNYDIGNYTHVLAGALKEEIRRREELEERISLIEGRVFGEI
jgi:hypothetical protein